MNYLLDTNVISEWCRDPMDQNVRNWVGGVYEDDLALSVVTITEVRSGVARLPLGKRRQDLELWLQRDIRERFRGRILGVDMDVAEICGQLLGQNHLGIHVGRIMDIWLAAIALQHNLIVVTCNEQDFRGLGVGILNPWTDEPRP